MGNVVPIEKFYSDVYAELLDRQVISESQVLQDLICAKISAALYVERIRRDMTVQQFADLLDVSERTVRRWEAGHVNFSIKRLCNVAAKLRIGVDIKIMSTDNKCYHG